MSRTLRDALLISRRRKESKDQEQRRGGLGGRAWHSGELGVGSLEHSSLEESWGGVAEIKGWKSTSTGFCCMGVFEPHPRGQEWEQGFIFYGNFMAQNSVLRRILNPKQSPD